jgi:hypothetical protein
MIPVQLKALFERAAGDPAFRARLLAHPALAEGLARDQVEKLLAEMALLDGQLTDDLLDGVVGGLTGPAVGPCHSTMFNG